MSEESESATAADVLFLVMAFCGGTIFCLLPRTYIKLPYTVLMFLYGVFIGLVGHQINPEVCSVLGDIHRSCCFTFFCRSLLKGASR